MEDKKQREVIMYTMKNCSFCKQLKELLDAKSIVYVEKDNEVNINWVRPNPLPTLHEGIKTLNGAIGILSQRITSMQTMLNNLQTQLTPTTSPEKNEKKD